jgi:hypothetical protein
MQNNYNPSTVLRLIFCVYLYMLAMASANVANCEFRKEKNCGDQWTQAFTVSGGAATTLWAFITDNPTQDSQKQPKPRPRTVPTTRKPKTKDEDVT